MTPDSSERARSDDAAISAVRREAFRRLLEGHAPAAGEIATPATLSKERIEAAIAELRATGALEVDPDGHVVGAHGLTQRATEHVIITAERVLHTWCALDAIGIPVALNLAAEVRTRCPTCAATIVLVVRDRAPVATEAPPVLWYPGGPCTHVMDDFCATANLFCNAEHLEHWHAQAGEPPGQALTLSEAADEGLHIWSDVKQ
jgi:predicted transcriptional regulator